MCCFNRSVISHIKLKNFALLTLLSTAFSGQGCNIGSSEHQKVYAFFNKNITENWVLISEEFHYLFENGRQYISNADEYSSLGHSSILLAAVRQYISNTDWILIFGSFQYFICSWETIYFSNAYFESLIWKNRRWISPSDHLYSGLVQWKSLFWIYKTSSTERSKIPALFIVRS